MLPAIQHTEDLSKMSRQEEPAGGTTEHSKTVKMLNPSFSRRGQTLIQISSALLMTTILGITLLVTREGLTSVRFVCWLLSGDGKGHSNDKLWCCFSFVLSMLHANVMAKSVGKRDPVNKDNLKQTEVALLGSTRLTALLICWATITSFLKICLEVKSNQKLQKSAINLFNVKIISRHWSSNRFPPD